MRLDVESFSFPSYSTSVGTSPARPVCISTHSTLTSVLQLASGSGSGCDRCFHSELGSEQRFCQPTLVPNYPLSILRVSAAGKDSDANALVEHSTMVSSDSWNAGGLSSSPPQQTGSSDSTSRIELYNASPLITWPISGIPSHHKIFLEGFRATPCILES